MTWQLKACWVAGLVALSFPLSFYNLAMLCHLKLGTRLWKIVLLRKVPDPEELDDAGQKFRRRFFRLLWITIAYLIVGLILFSVS